MKYTGKLDRAIGALVGSAIGDTFGAPLEFRPAITEPKNWVTEITGGGGFGWRPGEVTDDTIMANAITQMYLQHGRYNQTFLVNQWLDWLHRGPKDIGSWTRQALHRMEREKTRSGMFDHFHWGSNRHGLRDEKHPAVKLWKSAGWRDAGNGGVMRCVPSALATPRARDRIREVRWICEDTHPDPRAIASCIGVVETCAQLIAGDSVEVAVGAAFSRIKFKTVIPWCDTWKSETIFESYENTLFLVKQAMLTSKSLPWHKWTNSGYTIGTIESAFAALHQCDSFEDGLVMIVNRGNDADSVGAVAGSLLGAKFGFEAIPKRWFDKLENGQQYVDNAIRLYQQIRSNR